ncbi:MAG: carboxypeptidase regulatory-like domain-containing protein [Oscillochloris sp.]|nr:carboxypeptidase regulatory-like domain-containing protein [Oscillochloris sp.]
MLIGYVSDERYLALADVLVEFERDGRSVAVVRSTPRGGIYADLEAGRYRVTLVKPGYGAKLIDLELDGAHMHQLRLLSDHLLGYMWPRWVRAGERAEFRVHSVAPYRLSLWRYGRSQEWVRLLGWFDEHGPLATMQVTPDGDYTQIGVQWNRRGYGSSPHHSQLAEAPTRSGLYYLHAENERGEFFSFPWVVAPAKPTAPIAVLASTNTWNAYNNFGGRSNYINAAGLPNVPIVNARLELPRYQDGTFSEWGAVQDNAFPPLSFERPEPGNVVPRGTQPTDPIAGRLASSLAPAEWRLLAWLEREAFDYDYYAEAQLHNGTLDLDAYQVLIISVHPEYWTRPMYELVREWADRGGRLMYLGGNGLNCEVEFPTRSAMRCKTHLRAEGGALGMHDPNDPQRYYESRFHRTVAPEASLLGVVTTETGIMTAAPYQVRCADHWVFRGTGLPDGAIFGTASLHERCNGGASGHETDKLSPHAPPGSIVLAKGLNPDDGGAEMVYHERSGGGAVFSVGSITYVSSLLVDDVISRITRNVLERFLRHEA